MSGEMRPQDRSPATKADLRDFATKAELQASLATMRDEIIGAVRDMIRPLAVDVVHLKADVADVRGHIKDKLVTREEFHSRMDGFARRVEDHDWSAAKNRARLDDHESRLKSLEDERASS